MPEWNEAKMWPYSLPCCPFLAYNLVSISLLLFLTKMFSFTRCFHAPFLPVVYWIISAILEHLVERRCERTKEVDGWKCCSTALEDLDVTETCLHRFMSEFQHFWRTSMNHTLPKRKNKGKPVILDVHFTVLVWLRFVVTCWWKSENFRVPFWRFFVVWL